MQTLSERRYKIHHSRILTLYESRKYATWKKNNIKAATNATAAQNDTSEKRPMRVPFLPSCELMPARHMPSSKIPSDNTALRAH